MWRAPCVARPAACTTCGEFCVFCVDKALDRRLWPHSIRAILQQWASLSVGLCGRERFIDLAVCVLYDEQCPVFDLLALDMGLYWLEKRSLRFRHKRLVDYTRCMRVLLCLWRRRAQLVARTRRSMARAVDVDMGTSGTSVYSSSA